MTMDASDAKQQNDFRHEVVEDTAMENESAKHNARCQTQVREMAPQSGQQQRSSVPERRQR